MVWAALFLAVLHLLSALEADKLADKAARDHRMVIFNVWVAAAFIIGALK